MEWPEGEDDEGVDGAEEFGWEGLRSLCVGGVGVLGMSSLARLAPFWSRSEGMVKEVEGLAGESRVSQIPMVPSRLQVARIFEEPGWKATCLRELSWALRMWRDCCVRMSMMCEIWSPAAVASNESS